MNKLGYWIIVYVVCFVIIYFSSSSMPLGKTSMQGTSNWVLHLFEYGILSTFVYLAFLNDNSFRNKKTSTFLFVAMFAVMDELLQSFVPGRDGSMLDIMVDIAGNAVVLLFI